jgi:lipoic acid synthetase
MTTNTTDFPKWLKRPLPTRGELGKMKEAFRSSGLHTVCESARCPNIGECFSNKTATYMISGNVCTRVCGFCDVKSGRPLPLNPEEPKEIAQSAKALGLNYIVITAVNRDDLKDGGASQFKAVAEEIRKILPQAEYEFLIPDFNGKLEPLITTLECLPTVLNHNLETVERLTPEVRSKAQFQRSLEVLRNAKTYGKSQTKTGLMLGLGETKEELLKTFDQVAQTQVDILTMGQYLRPSEKHLTVQRYLPEEEFEELKTLAQKAGIATVYSGPFVRSSFHAGEIARMSQDNILSPI